MTNQLLYTNADMLVAIAGTGLIAVVLGAVTGMLILAMLKEREEDHYE
jgi:hypothetical protein